MASNIWNIDQLCCKDNTEKPSFPNILNLVSMFCISRTPSPISTTHKTQALKPSKASFSCQNQSLHNEVGTKSDVKREMPVFCPTIDVLVSGDKLPIRAAKCSHAPISATPIFLECRSTFDGVVFRTIKDTTPTPLYHTPKEIKAD